MKCKEWILRLVEVEEMCSVSDLRHGTGFLSTTRIFVMFTFRHTAAIEAGSQ